MRDELAGLVVDARDRVADLAAGAQAFAFGAQMSLRDRLQVVELQVYVDESRVLGEPHERGPERRGIDQRRQHAAVDDAERLHVVAAQVELDAAAVDLEPGDLHADQRGVGRRVHDVLHGAHVGRVRRHGGGPSTESRL